MIDKSMARLPYGSGRQNPIIDGENGNPTSNSRGIAPALAIYS